MKTEQKSHSVVCHLCHGHDVPFACRDRFLPTRRARARPQLTRIDANDLCFREQDGFYVCKGPRLSLFDRHSERYVELLVSEIVTRQRWRRWL